MMDVSDRKRLEQQLIQSQKMEAVGRLAGGVAHDFNNLLTAISGYNELVLSQLPPGDPRRGHAEEIRRAADRAAGLTQQLLAYSRRQVLEPKVLDLNAVVSSMEKMLRRLIGEDVELATMQQPGLWPVRADPGQLEQVVLNLAVNARDAMPRGGRLQIATGNVAVDAASALSGVALVPGDYAVLTVADNGLGMTPEVKARLFEPFFTTKEKGKGTGLGLSTVYGIVKQSGGYIWVDSEPGRGTAFRVYLPRCHAEPDRLEPPPASPESTTAGSETILLVEDEPEVRNLVEKLLAMQGYTVLVAASPSEALQLCEKERRRIDLLLTDVVMPDMSGRELARRLEPSRPEMRVLYMSGYTEDAIGRHGVLDPEIAFLQKPFSPDALARKVREGLGATPGQLKNS
jgi:two-component system, cell cycle sensor histidine kinase and response regulator CckA